MRLIIHGCYHNKNFGDILLLNLLSDYIRNELKLIPTSPWVRKSQKVGLNCKRGKGWFDILSANIAIYGGGGYLVNGGQKTRRYLLPAKIWQRKKVPYIILGVGVGPDISGIGANRVKTIVAGADFITVRDKESKDLLVSIGCDTKKITVTADIAIDFSIDKIPRWAKDYAEDEFKKFSNGKRYLGLHLPDLKGDRSLTLTHPFYARTIDSKLIQTLKLLNKILENEKNIEPIWIDTGWTKKYEKDLKKACRQYLPSSKFTTYKNHWVTASILGKLDTIITTKLHIGIVAWALGVPCCSFAKHGKTKRFYRQIGREAYVSGFTSEVDIIGRWVNQFVHDYDNYKIENSQARELLKEKSKLNMDILKEWMKREFIH